MFPERLTKGYRAFLEGRFVVERGRYQNLAATGQSPSIMVVGCVDSRVSPEVIFDAAPGELLVARNVANIVPRYEAPTTPANDISHQHGTSAALEFASVELSLKNLMTFPFVKSAVEAGELRLHGAYFGVASGRLLVRNEGTGMFEPVRD